MSALHACTIGNARSLEAKHWAVVPGYWLFAAAQAFGWQVTGDSFLALTTVVFTGMAGLLTWARLERVWGRRQ